MSIGDWHEAEIKSVVANYFERMKSSFEAGGRVVITFSLDKTRTYLTYDIDDGPAPDRNALHHSLCQMHQFADPERMAHDIINR